MTALVSWELLVFYIDMIWVFICSSHRLTSRRNRASRSIFANLQATTTICSACLALDIPIGRDER